MKSFLWVKMIDCEACGRSFDLFPGYLLAENRRHPRTSLSVRLAATSTKSRIVRALEIASHARPRCAKLDRTPGALPLPALRTFQRLSRRIPTPLDHRLFAIEYHNPRRKAGHKGRFFKKPDAEDIARVGAAAKRWKQLTPRFVPNQEILPGDETSRLHRWGYACYRDMFNPRQLLGLELSCRLIFETKDERIRHALATNLSDLLRYQNMLCRYDTMALKSLDIFSVHGFPVGLVQCESNLLGIVNGTGSNVGSGGWSNIVDKYVKAKRYCEAPFEVRRNGSRNVRVPIKGERIGEGSTVVAVRSPFTARTPRKLSLPSEALMPCSRTRPISATFSTANSWIFATSGFAALLEAKPRASIVHLHGRRTS